ncbi:MAG: hypothetical protein MUC62_04235 [Candidatus Thermoplasmatota archaeon]|jgi:dolichol kinase|nr:hypothetical protein [Candidatus Thermoplasmatota archaeon]
MDGRSGAAAAAGARSELRIRRKVFHLALGTAFILLFLGDRDIRWPLFLVLFLGLALSYVQGRWPLRPLKWLLDRYDKRSDHVPGQGPITFFLGCLVAWSLFPHDAALGAMVVLTFGDPFAYLAGTLLGGWKLPWNDNKTWAGTAGFLLVPVCILVPLMGPVIGLLLPLAGAVVESLDLPKALVMDDNVTVPIATGALGALLLGSFPGL